MDRSKTDFPLGDGHPDCPDCKGRGVVPVPQEERPLYAVGEVTQFCRCTFRRDLMDNLKRAWTHLLSVKGAKDSPLVGRERDCLWIHAPLPALKAHLRAVGIRQSPRWRFKVISDMDLMTTWLYSADEVIDPDVSESRSRGRNQHARISDLVEPYSLLIIRLGVKAARNQATPEVFLEALLHREQEALPTWIVDRPGYPLQEGHLAWSPEVQDYLEEWEWVTLEGTDEETVPVRYPEIPTVSEPTEFGMGQSEEEEEPEDDGDDDALTALLNKTEDEPRKKKGRRRQR